MKKYYLTFLTNHDQYGDKTPHGYITIYAPSYQLAREVAFANLGNRWGFIGDHIPSLLGSVGELDELYYQVVEGHILTKDDIDSPMTYIPPHAESNASHPDSEHGHLSSFNEHGIWVRFNSSSGQLCKSESLVWG